MGTLKQRFVWAIALVVAAAPLSAQAPEASRWLGQLGRLVAIRDIVRDIHPFLGTLFPVAVVEGGNYLIFDTDAGGKSYVFIKSAPAPDTLPQGIRAAFPLDVYDGRMVCVVSSDAFDTAEGFVFILHEFIHCAQWECCEAELKGKLGVARTAMEKQDYLWELQYPFPYGNSKVAKAYSRFMKAALDGDAKKMDSGRRRLRKLLGTSDFEYMAWEEFKEGFARHVENLVRRKLDLPINQSGREMPLTRISFYAGGAATIAQLCGNDPALCSDLPRLFSKLMGPSQGNSTR